MHISQKLQTLPVTLIMWDWRSFNCLSRSSKLFFRVSGIRRNTVFWIVALRACLQYCAWILLNSVQEADVTFSYDQWSQSQFRSVLACSHPPPGYAIRAKYDWTAKWVAHAPFWNTAPFNREYWLMELVKHELRHCKGASESIVQAYQQHEQYY